MLATLLLACVLQEPSPDGEREFRTQVEMVGPMYESAQRRTRPMILEGRMADAIQSLLDVVAEAERTAAHDFVLGNALFALDSELSRKLHERAFSLAPDNLFVACEVALEWHRAGEHAKAEPVYAKLVASKEFARGPYPALRADCLLHLGRIPEALASWKASKPSSNHTAIEQAFSWVYGDASPWTRRDRLLAKVRASDADAAEELILHDLSFDDDWWNVRVEPECLERDLPEAAKALGAESARWRELELLAKCRTEGEAGGDDMPPELRRLTGAQDEAALAAAKALAESAKALGILGEGAHLPQSSHVASHLFQSWTSLESAEPSELLAWFEDELWKRAKSEKGDLDALEILAALYERTSSPRLGEADELGWTRYHDRRFGCSLLAARAGELRPDDALLADALARHGEDARVHGFALQAARNAGAVTPELLSRQIQAEFRRLETYQSVKGLFAELESLLKDK